MELYIPPPSTFLPRLPPPRPVVPAVPIVPVPDLPDTIYAPEGAYTKETKLFPSIGTPTPPITYDPRPMAPAASFIGGAGGFIVPVPGQPGQPTGQTALSFGSTVVNGQTQPAWPVRMSWVTVYFPAKTGVEKQSGFGGLLGMGNTAGGASGTGNQPPQPPTMSGYEPSVSSDDSSPTSSDNPPPPIPIEVPLSALPQQGKRMPFIKTAIPSGLPRPKNNLRSSSSTFVTRLQALDSLPKIMAEKGRGGPETVRWGFWNLGRTLGWGEEGGKVKDALARVTFSQVPTCHAISHFTAGPDRVDLVVGFSSGDLVWLDFVIGKYTRINKGGLLNNTAVISVKFDPRHPHYFISTFADGTVLKFNLFAEDPVATTIDLKNMPWKTYFDRQMGISEPGTPGPGDLASKSHKKMQNGLKDNVDENSMLIWKNEEFGNLAELTKKLNKGEERKPWAGRNPMGAMKLGKSAINALAYSPDARTLAVVSEDGALRLVDVEDQRLTDTFAGYFGALNCVAWSPDSRFLVVGGQDDLITIYSPREGRVVARCQGHSAFVTAIKFDSSRGGGYRFGSVGEDGKLVLWDFTAAQLHRPRHHHPSNSSHHRLAAGSSLSLANQAQAQAEVNKAGGRYHPAPPRSEVALLQPVMARVIEGNLLTSIYFTPSAIYTISRAALVKVWQRPPRQSSAANKRNMLKTLAQKPNEELRSPRGRDSMLVA